MNCHYHPRAKAFTVCSVCGVNLCMKCMIEDMDKVFCDSCYAEDGHNDDGDDLEQGERDSESEDYIDLELMDALDTDDDDGLF